MTQEQVHNALNLCIQNKSNTIYINNYEGEIPKELYDFHWIKELTIDSCALVDTQSIGKMKNLEQLRIRWCGIDNINEFHALINLWELTLEGNNIPSIPDNLPKSIKTLEINDNCITSLETLELLPNLIDVYAQNNRISRLPDFENNELLQLLEVGINCISEFPFSIIEKNIERITKNQFDIHVYNNPFIKKLQLNPEDYKLYNDWGYVSGLSNSVSLLKDYRILNQNTNI
jgi:hypothetical protein